MNWFRIVSSRGLSVLINSYLRREDDIKMERLEIINRIEITRPVSSRDLWCTQGSVHGTYGAEPNTRGTTHAHFTTARRRFRLHPSEVHGVVALKYTCPVIDANMISHLGQYFVTSAPQTPCRCETREVFVILVQNETLVFLLNQHTFSE